MIAVDIDNTIAQFSEHVLRRTEQELGLPAGSVPYPEDYDERAERFPPDVQASALKLIVHKHRGQCLDTLLSCPADEDARATLITLHRHGLLGAYVTRRHRSTAHATQRWLAAHGFPERPVLHASELKSTVLREHGLSGIIEDAPHEAHEISAHYPVALIARPYNRSVRGPNIFPFERWHHLPIDALLGR